jgi:ribosomal protein S12 methylthiotransferase accessory factor
MRPTGAWDERSEARADLETDLATALTALKREGCDAVYRVDLTRPDMQIPVVKVLIPGMAYRPNLF